MDAVGRPQDAVLDRGDVLGYGHASDSAT
jgi:hypothetical protein